MDFNEMRQMEMSRDASSSRDSSLEPDYTLAQPYKNAKGLDRRRESSKYAARDRRGKEADIFADLKEVVPIVDESTVTHVDRIALLRVASTMCRMRRNASKFLETDLPAEDPNVEVFAEHTLTECLDGFILLADSDGTILYASESVSLFLGLTQTDFVGRFLNEFVHSDDYDELIRWSTTDCDAEEASTLDDFGRYLVVRMKTVISPRGRTLNLKSALYKAILCRFRAVTTEHGRLSLLYGSSTPAGQGNSLMLANSSVKGAEATSGVYMTRHTCDMRFSYVSDGFNHLLKHDNRSLMGASFYDLVHPADIHSITQSFRELFKKAHCRTPFYRLLGPNNSVAWAQTESTTVNHTARGQKGQYVLCVHSIIGMQSEVESWAEPIIDSSTAGNSAIFSARIKREIPDMAEYAGLQPEFVECVDFTPLINPDIDINFSDYNPVHPVCGRRQAKRNGHPDLIEELDSSPQAKQQRKKSFDVILDWLVQDEVNNPPPAFATSGMGRENEEVFSDLAGYNQPARRHSFREQRKWKTREQFGVSSASSLSRRTNPVSGAPIQSNAAGKRGSYDSARNQCKMARADMETDSEQKQNSYETVGRQQRFSRLDIHQRHTGTNNLGATVIGQQRSQPNRTISAFPTKAGYSLPTSNQCVSGMARSQDGRSMRSDSIENSPTLHSPLCSSNTSQQTNYSTRVPEDNIQFIGEFQSAPDGKRSRSNSSTTSSYSYEQSAARRYSTQNSPAPPRLPSCGAESRQLRALNVNQMASAPRTQLKYPNQHNQQQINQPFPNASPSTTDYYYSAQSLDNSEQPVQRYDYRDDYSNIPAKRSLYDNDVSYVDCQKQQCDKNLSYLAPYVPIGSEEIFEIGDLDLQNFDSIGVNLNEYLLSELSPNPPPQVPINKQPETRPYLIHKEKDNQMKQFPNLDGTDPILTDDWSFGQY